LDWLSYFDLAQEWVNQGGEARQRSAVSRAYYAMFCTVRDKLQILDDYSLPKSGSQHKDLWDFCEQDRYRVQRRQIGVLGNRLRKARNEADYTTVIFNLSDLVEGAMLDAEELKDNLDAL
jgi:uncharacterized protein (UPF0332 family)